MPKVLRRRSKKELEKLGHKSVRGASSTTSFPIVAIGASAGGFEAFSTLLRDLPPEPGMALIFIPHLDPTLADERSTTNWQPSNPIIVVCQAGLPRLVARFWIVPKSFYQDRRRTEPPVKQRSSHSHLVRKIRAPP